MKVVSNVKLIFLLVMILAVWVQCSHTFEPEPTCEDDFGNETGPVFVAYDEPPKPVGGFAAIQWSVIYTEAARRLGIEGRVVVHVFVCKTGVVTDSRILQSLGYGLDETAVSAVKSVKWIPAMQRDSPVSVWVAIPVIFRLK